MSKWKQSQRLASAASRGSAEPDNDKNVEKVSGELEALRGAMGRHLADTNANFRGDIFHARWTAANRKVSCDAFQAPATTKKATQFGKWDLMFVSARLSLI